MLLQIILKKMVIPSLKLVLCFYISLHEDFNVVLNIIIQIIKCSLMTLTGHICKLLKFKID